jgi:hypothetical protein
MLVNAHQESALEVLVSVRTRHLLYNAHHLSALGVLVSMRRKRILRSAHHVSALGLSMKVGFEMLCIRQILGHTVGGDSDGGRGVGCGYITGKARMAVPDSDGLVGSDSGGFRAAPQGDILAYFAVCCLNILSF